MKSYIYFHKLVYLITTLLILYSCGKESLNPNYKLSESESLVIKVGLYNDFGAFDECITSTQSMLDKMNCSYVNLNKDSILDGNLNHYTLLLMPGGDMWHYRNNLTSAGMNKIREYLNNGGGYIGICGGSYFAADTIIWRGWADEPRKYLTTQGLGLFQGNADGPIEDFAPSYQDTQCEVKILDKTHFATNNIADIIRPYYSFGPKFLLKTPSNISIIGKTKNGDNIIMLAFQYNHGRVFISGTHFEFDEARSSWELLKNAIIWCSIEQS